MVKVVYSNNYHNIMYIPNLQHNIQLLKKYFKKNKNGVLFLSFLTPLCNKSYPLEMMSSLLWILLYLRMLAPFSIINQH